MTALSTTFRPWSLRAVLFALPISIALLGTSVFAQSTPNPVTSLSCDRIGETVELSWINAETYDSILITSRGHSEVLPGSSQNFTHLSAIEEGQERLYRVIGVVSGIATDERSCSTIYPHPGLLLFMSPAQAFLGEVVQSNLNFSNSVGEVQAIVDVVCHDSSKLELLNVTASPFLVSLDLQSQGFSSIDFVEDTENGDTGFAIAMIVSLLGTATIPISPSVSLYQAEYRLVAEQPGDTVLYSCDGFTIGSTQVAASTVVIANSPVRTSAPPTSVSLRLREFVRGDANSDGATDLGDALTVLVALFTSATLPCEQSADSNSSGLVDIGDAVFLLNFLFSNGPILGSPFPDCGVDLDLPPLPCADYSYCGP